MRNIAFIDGQNLYMGTKKKEIYPWEIDLFRFNVYLAKKYSVDKSYYFLGFVQECNSCLYKEIRKAGFNLIFREHNPSMVGKKKGNVDSDIIFYVMKMLYKNDNFNNIIIVSGDGDYKLLIDFLIGESRFEKILFPDRNKRSSLYKSLSNKFFAYLDDCAIKNKIAKKKRVP